jgi:hypothetical protein
MAGADKRTPRCPKSSTEPLRFESTPADSRGALLCRSEAYDHVMNEPCHHHTSTGPEISDASVFRLIQSLYTRKPGQEVLTSCVQFTELRQSRSSQIRAMLQQIHRM